MAQLVRAPPCHGGGHGFESRLGRLWDFSSAGRASALQAEGHRFEPCRSHRCKASCRRGGTGRRAGLKILWWRHRTGSIPVAGINFFKKLTKYVCVAQLDRALGYGPRCRGFESSHARPLRYRKPLIYKGLRYFFALDKKGIFCSICSISKFWCWKWDNIGFFCW